MRTPHPYRQVTLGPGHFLRVFDPDTGPHELVWHQDLRDRRIHVMECSGWKLQLEKGLPIDLREGQDHVIPARSWHRVIKGDGRMIIEIVES